MRQIVQMELKCNEKMGVEGVRNRGHGEMWIASASTRDGIHSLSRLAKAWETQKMVKIWQELFHLVRSADHFLDPDSFFLHYAG